MNNTQREGITVKEAVKVLCDALSEDRTEGSYYYSWQANIAMSFYDEYRRQKESAEIIGVKMKDTHEVIHNIANQAAKNFLDLLVGTPYNHHPVILSSPLTVDELKAKFAQHLQVPELETSDAYAVEWTANELKH